MEVFGLVKVTEEESPTVLPVQDIQMSTTITNFCGKPQELICLTKRGHLLHFSDQKLLKCFNFAESFPGNGPVKKMEHFLTSSGRGCVALLQELACLVFEVGDCSTFILRHTEKASPTSDIFAFDFLRKGTQQLLFKDNDLSHYLDLDPGGIIVQIGLNEKGSKEVNTAISRSIEKVRNSILKIQEDSMRLNNLVTSALVMLGGPSVGTHEESEMVASFFGNRRIIPQTSKLQTVAMIELQVASKLIRHSGKIAAIFKIVNNSTMDLKNLTLLPDLCPEERVTFRVDFSGSSSHLVSTKGQKVILQFDENFSRQNYNDPTCRTTLECVDASGETEFRYPLPDMSLIEEASQSDTANNLRDKFVALKKIFLKKNLTVTTFFSDVRPTFQNICRRNLNFDFIEAVGVYSRDDKIFFTCKVERGEKHKMELELYGESEGCLKSFLQSFYFHAPDDLLIKPRQHNESRTSSRRERFARSRDKLAQELTALLSCFETTSVSKDNAQKVFDHLEGTKSVYEGKRKAFQSRCPNLKIPKQEYFKARRGLTFKEIETDSAFS